MLIDWFTVAAQVVNFLILVWLLRRFLYTPILNAIDAREQRIARQLADADAKALEARQQHDEFQRKNQEVERQRELLMRWAADEAKAERQRLFEEARQEAAALRAKRQETLSIEAQNLQQALGRRAQQEVLAIARQVLADLAATSLEQAMVAVFLRRLRAMDGATRQGLADALKRATAPALVRSAFELPDVQRAAIQHALQEIFGAEIPLRFETAPDLIGGIEFTTNGHKLAWSIADYLSSLGKGIDELLKQQAQTQAEAKRP